MKQFLHYIFNFAIAFTASTAMVVGVGNGLMAQKMDKEERSCLPVSTNWRLSPELNHTTWLEDSLGCDGVRIMILASSHADDFQALVKDAGRDYVQKALGPPRRSFINAARLHIDVYPISCEQDGNGQGLDALIVFTKEGCLGEIFFQGQ